ncbi:histidine kinase [Stenotrophomonas ginsengisoli]|uniref:histidine kinase n=1 Tax=Stenotrophomonas ginsengisoli TaxID=336566 RepID=A0A0R0CZG7_9GAMM|nr:ATP-binding protein [Stenotrophomonas ginsengisoli]KRG75055.1 histidine kinase [Stenotrophomonas ginsengisoli]
MSWLVSWRNEHARLGLLALAAVLIIVLPWLLMRGLWDRSQQATERVDHTQVVGALLYRLQADIRDFESAALTLSKGVSTPELQQRMRLADGFPDTLAELADKLQDNPAQLVRVGRIQARLERRVNLARQIAELQDIEQQRPLVEELVVGAPIRSMVTELQAEERRLLQLRYADSLRRDRMQEWVSWLALGLQLALLVVVLWLMLRQLRARLQVESTIAQTALQATAVLNSVREPIALLDRQLNVTLRNPAFDQMYGLVDSEGMDAGPAGDIALSDVGGKAWSKDEVVLQRLRDVANRGREMWDHELEQLDADGNRRVLLLNAQRIGLPDSKAPAVLMTLADVSAQRSAQLRVEQLNRQLEGKIDQVTEVNQELEAFSYSVSHDLRAPLRHIAGFADKLGKHLGEQADEKSAHYLQVIGGSARRMSTLIDDLLVYSRLGRGAMRLQAVDMQSLVAETRAMLDATLRSDAEAAGQMPRHVQWNIASLPMVLADENMMRQVWLNLLGNAVKYSAGRDPAVITVSSRQLDDGGHEFTVSDNGAGFDMNYAGKLFGVFQRLHKASEYSGTGIGLASVRRVLTRHGGKVWAEAEVDRGADFHFILPSALDASNQETQA